MYHLKYDNTGPTPFCFSGLELLDPLHKLDRVLLWRRQQWPVTKPGLYFFMDSVRKLLDTPECKQEFWIFDTGNTMAYLSLFYIEEIRANKANFIQGNRDSCCVYPPDLHSL